jgi:predicted DNA binding CopG/RHH family protein
MARQSKVERKSSVSDPTWYTTQAGRLQTQKEFERALRSGTLMTSKGSTISRSDAKVLAELAEKAHANATRAISIRLPLSDLDRARRIASKQGIGYQTVLKRAIRAGMEKVS